MMVRIKRIYDKPASSDGERILVDRLWPRGVSKEKAALDMWLKDVAPSTALRVWFDHKPERFAEFSEKYREELRQNPAVAVLRELYSKKPNVTLLYADKDPRINHAVVLRQYLEQG